VTKDEPEVMVGAVAKSGKFLEAVVDSGAEESVAPPGFFPGAMVPSAMSRVGGRYRAANGTRIRNLGQQSVTFSSTEGHRCEMPFQIAEVERPLISVSQMAAAGNVVTLDESGGRIANKRTGKAIELIRRGGVYIMRMAVASDFPGQGR